MPSRGLGRSVSWRAGRTPDVLVGVILYQTAVLQHVVVAAVDDIHPFLVVHGKPVLVDHRLQIVQQMGTFFQQFGVSQSNRAQFFRRKIRVAEHTLEAGDIDVRDIAHHQDGLLNLAGIPDKVLDLAKPVVILLALLVDFTVS